MRTPSKRSGLSKSVVSVAGLFLCFSSSAHAEIVTRNYHASLCQVISGTPTFNSAGQIGNTTGSDVVLWCPLIADPTVALPGPGNGVRVDTFSNGCSAGIGAGVSAAVVVVPQGGGNSASAGSSSPGSCTPGVYELTPGVVAVGANDTAYLRVVLHKAINGSSNTFFGYRLHNVK
jgi:hypothetical protein